jgi:glycosyltransferase involved in cell wall biosynthesis
VVRDHRSSAKLEIVWIYSGSLAMALDAATWLRTVTELRHFGWHVTLVAVGSNGYCQVRGVEVLCIPRPEIYFFRHAAYHLRVVRLLMRQCATIDLILFHEISAPWILPLRLVRRLTGKRRPALVMDTRSLPMPVPDKQTWKGKLRKAAYFIGKQLGNRFADGRLAITPRMAAAVGIPPTKLWGTWASGADVEHFALARTNRHWPSPDDSIRLIYHGSMHYERNLMALCRAVIRANAQGMPFHLSLVGDGTERAELEDFAAQAKGAVRVLMPVSYETVPEVLSRAHVGVLPFSDEEQFRVSSPIKLFEYMAAGLPLLATRIVSHTDVVGCGRYVFWADDAGEQGLLDALCLVWQSRELLSEMGRRAAIAAERWTWTASAVNLKNALERGYELFVCQGRLPRNE